MKVIRIRKDESEKDREFFRIFQHKADAKDGFLIPSEILMKVGGCNDRLKAERLYELLLRIADAFSIQIEEMDGLEELNGYMAVGDMACESKTEAALDRIYADCYIVSRYKDKLLQNAYFDSSVKRILEYASDYGVQETAVALLEKMLMRGEEYYFIDDAVRPILIYIGEDICHNVLNVFAEQFGEALERAGQRVEYFNSEIEGYQKISQYIGKHYRAVVGMQTYLFSIKMLDGKQYVHDLICAPKFNFIFDHPIWMKNHLIDTPQNFYVITHDENYVNFTEQYYKKKAYLLPPGGKIQEIYDLPKIYDISFVGTYGNYWEEVLQIHQMDRDIRFLANRFLLIMRKEVKLTAEEALHQVLKKYGQEKSPEEFMDLFYKLRRVIYCVMHYYRHCVIQAMLESGLQVDVFGDSWECCPLRKYTNLVCHPDVTTEESVLVWQQSKMSLNIMSWHKGGFTERMANILLNRTVLVTDETTCLEGRFEAGRDLIAFRLDHLEQLPKYLKGFLENNDKLEKMAQNGWEKASKYHTWDCRAREFLHEILE